MVLCVHLRDYSSCLPKCEKSADGDESSNELLAPSSPNSSLAFISLKGGAEHPEGGVQPIPCPPPLLWMFVPKVNQMGISTSSKRLSLGAKVAIMRDSTFSYIKRNAQALVAVRL